MDVLPSHKLPMTIQTIPENFVQFFWSVKKVFNIYSATRFYQNLALNTKGQKIQNLIYGGLFMLNCPNPQKQIE